MMSFGGRVTLSLRRSLMLTPPHTHHRYIAATAASNACRQPDKPARFYGVLLAGMFGLALAGCGGGSGGGSSGGTDNGQNTRAVSNIQTLVGEDHIFVGWTNPDQMNITGFNITRHNVDDDTSEGDTTELNSTMADVAPLARVIYNIMDLTNNTAYRITITVLYKDGDTAMSSPVSGTTGADQGIGLDGDIDIDGLSNMEDNCPLVRNPGQDDNDTDRLGDVCDPDDDNDGLPDVADATTAADNCQFTDNPGQDDNDTDGLGDACDPDDDNDGLPDVANATTAADNCQFINNPGQSNNDQDALGDVCDDDNDNDGVDDIADACPTGMVGWTSLAGTDNDGDGCRDNDEDVDDNNNRLIEIRTLDDLARLRDDLNGDGEDDGNVDEITSVGSVGCPDTVGCSGYELARSLNFSDVASYVTGSGSSGNMDDWTDRAGSGWLPIGSCSDADVCTSYTGIFDGGGYTLAGLFIAADDTVNGVGLFAALTGDIQNLHLLNASVSGGDNAVGTLVGYGRNARYENLSVTSSSVMSPDADVVGGLVGDGRGAVIRYAHSTGVDVSGGDFSIGGLVGNGQNMDIRYAYVSDGSVVGEHDVGGLVGNGRYIDIRYAYVSDGSVFGTGIGFNIGGLVGGWPSSESNSVFSVESDIRYAYASGVNVSGRVKRLGGSAIGSSNVGGLIGFARNFDIRYAYVSGGSVTGVNVVGGLVGDGQNSNIRYSYAAGGLVSSFGINAGGLLGNVNMVTTVNASYWDNQTTRQSASAGDLGEGQTTALLQNPSTFTGIYADWGNIRCDPDTGEVIEEAIQPAGFLSVWDLGDADQYPVLNCLPVSVEEQQRRQ